MDKILPNYHNFSKKEEDKREEELLLLIGILLNSLSEIKHLDKQVIKQTIQSWKLEYWEELNRINKESLINIDTYINKLLPCPKCNHDLIISLLDANVIMFSIIIDYIYSRYRGLSVLENIYHYHEEQSTEFVQDTAHMVENKVNIFVVQSAINNLREILFDHAKINGYTQYRWRTQRDDRVRPSHADMDDTWVDIDNPPARTGHMHVGEDYNCRCYAIEFR